MSEKPIYELIKGDRKQGIRLLYERYGKKLYGYGIHSWKLNEDDAWELAYQALYKVCDNIEKYSFDNEKGFASFLFTIFMNLVRNFFRDSKMPAHASLEDFPELSNSPGESLADTGRLALLKEELDKLEDWERVLLLLRSQDIPYTEIAKYTGKTADTLKVYYGRLKDKLAKRMNEKHFNKDLK